MLLQYPEKSQTQPTKNFLGHQIWTNIEFFCEQRKKIWEYEQTKKIWEHEQTKKIEN